jgi:hypothetical protein
MGARTDSAVSARAIGGAEVAKLARARSPSAAAAPATRAALIGRTRENVNTVSIHGGIRSRRFTPRPQIAAVAAAQPSAKGNDNVFERSPTALREKTRPRRTSASMPSIRRLNGLAWRNGGQGK